MTLLVAWAPPGRYSCSKAPAGCAGGCALCRQPNDTRRVCPRSRLQSSTRQSQKKKITEQKNADPHREAQFHRGGQSRESAQALADETASEGYPASQFRTLSGVSRFAISTCSTYRLSQCRCLQFSNLFSHSLPEMDFRIGSAEASLSSFRISFPAGW